MAVGKPRRAAARVAGDDRPFDLDRAAEERRGGADLAGGDEAADLREETPGRAARRAPRARGARQTRGRRPLGAEAEARRCGDHLGAEPEHVGVEEGLGRPSAATAGVNSTTSVSATPSSASSSSLPLERREELDLGAEHRARMRVEGDDGRGEPGRDCRGDRPRGGRDGRRRRSRSRRARGRRSSSPGERATFTGPPVRVGAPPPRPRAPARGAARGRGRAPRAGSRSSAAAAGEQPLRVGLLDRERPTAVRRRLTQCPPSAAASERT